MPKSDFVHARYLGGSQVTMEDLVGRPRCCQKKNHREDLGPMAVDEEGQRVTNPHTVLNQGDVILLDRFSAEGRDDFEVLDDSGKPKRKGRKKAGGGSRSRAKGKPAETPPASEPPPPAEAAAEPQA